MVTLQEILNQQYKNKGTNIIEIENQGNPTGTLNFTGYNNFDTLKLFGNNINDDNYFAILQAIPNKDKIKMLGFGGNQIKTPQCDYIGANFPNLEWLSIGGPIDPNTSVKGLGKLTKLKDLWIGDGRKYKDMDYLPISLNNYYDNANYTNNELKPAIIKRLNQENEQLKNDLNTAQPFAKKYEDLAIYWKDNLRTDLNNTPFHPDGLKEVKKTLDQLKADKTQLTTDRDQAKTDLTTANNKISALEVDKQQLSNDLNIVNSKITQLEKEKNTLNKNTDLVDYWNANLLTTFNSKPLSVESLRLVKDKWNQLQTEKSKFEVQSKNWLDIISERNKTVSELDDELRNRSSSIDELQNIINGLNAEIDELTIKEDKLQEEWKADFLKEDFGDKLDVESLKAVRKKLDILQKDNEEFYEKINELERAKIGLQEYWKLNLAEFGETLNTDSLAKIVEKLNSLDAELADKTNEITSLGSNIENLKVQLSEKEKEIVQKDSDIKLKDKTIADKEESIQQLQQNANNDKDLSNKIKELEDMITQSTKELKRETNQELTSFFQDMDISEDDINEKYGNNFDYETIIDEKMTLENRRDMKKAFKIVACICATEKFEELNKLYEKDPASRTERLQRMLEEIVKNWDKTASYQEIKKENNPFYLDNVIEKQEEYKKKIEVLWDESQEQLQNLQLELITK